MRSDDAGAKKYPGDYEQVHHGQREAGMQNVLFIDKMCSLSIECAFFRYPRDHGNMKKYLCIC